MKTETQRIIARIEKAQRRMEKASRALKDKSLVHEKVGELTELYDREHAKAKVLVQRLKQLDVHYQLVAVPLN